MQCYRGPPQSGLHLFPRKGWPVNLTAEYKLDHFLPIMTREEMDRSLTGDSHLQYLKRQRDQLVMGFPVWIALLGFLIYGCWQLDATMEEMVMVIPFPLLMLIITTIAFISKQREIREESDDHVA